MTQNKERRKQSRDFRFYTKSPSIFEEFAYALHHSLDVTQIIQQFARKLYGLVPFGQLTYYYDKETQFTLGDKQRFQIQYHLDVDGQRLGEFTFSKEKKFSKKEMQTIEKMLALLKIPLKNALAHRAIQQMAFCDPLTGVGNRAQCFPHIKSAMHLAKRFNKDLSLMVIDIDDFKRINDTFGHLVGDALLKHASMIMRKALRNTDVIFRLGGDEFLVLLENTPNNDACVVANRMREMLVTTPLHHNKQPINVTLSIGLAEMQMNDSINSFIDNADKALYTAKSQGKNICSSHNHKSLLKP